MSRVGQTAEAALVGAGASTLFWWQTLETDRANRLRQVQNDTRDVNTRITDLVSSGDWFRLTTGPVRDVVTGVATAVQVQPTPTAIPVSTVQSRPDLSGGNNIPGIAWPPVAATYDQYGNPQSFTELMTAGQVQTYQEPRAFAQGLCQGKPPAGAGLMQIFYAAQGLSTVASAQTFTLSQYQQAFTNLFSQAGTGQSGPAGQSAVDPHQDQTKNPTASPAISAITQVQPQPGAPNTDANQQWLFTQGAGTLNAGLPVFTVTFAKPYRYQPPSGSPTVFSPQVICTTLGFGVTGVSSSGFTVITLAPLSAAQAMLVSVLVVPGVQTV
jgi:hypothetical protein